MPSGTPRKKSNFVSRLVGQSKARQKVQVTVGLDFGTSTTKVVILADPERGERRRWAPKLFGQALYPSVVTVKDGLVTFGPARSGDVHRSIKMLYRAAVLDREPERPLEGSNVPIAAFVWGYLTRVVQELRTQLAKEFPADRYELGVEWQLGVPLAESQWTLELSFREVLYRAVHSPEGPRLPPLLELSELEQRYRLALKVEVPPEESSDVFVFAEAAVAVNAIALRRGQLEDGKYFVCDVGAGTTDTAFFWYAQKTQHPIHFYATSCKPYGGDVFINGLSKALKDGTGRRWGQERLHKEAEALLHAGRLDGAGANFSEVLVGLRRARQRAFGLARNIEQLHRWEEGLTGFLIGGGGKIDCVEEVLLSNLETGIGDGELRVFRRNLSVDRKAIPGATDLHWIASGLSIPVHEFEPYVPVEHATPIHESGDYIRPEWDDPYAK